MATMRFEDLTQQDEYGMVVCPSVEATLYSDESLSKLAEGVIACYRLFLDRFGSELQSFLASAMVKAQKFSQKKADVFPTLCGDPKLATLPMFRVFRGAGNMDYMPPVFMAGSTLNRFSCLQVQLPHTYADRPEDVLAFLGQLASNFPYRSGYAGLALCWNDLSVDRETVVPALIKPLLKRHPGLSPGLGRNLASQPMAPCNWLTLLGPGLLAAAGGLSRVKGDLAGDGISVIEMGHGACIRAGDVPKLGDLNRQDDLPLYRRVGAYLKPWRTYQKFRLKGMDFEETEAWLARFDS